MEANNKNALIDIGVVALLVLAGFIFIAIGWNQFIYGDWKYAFAECGIIK